MNSKECLENLTYCVNGMESQEKYYKIIKQDLDRVEMLEKALDKACELLADYTGICPFSKKLMYETNCDLNCKDTYKECWKKYFMKEVLGNKWYNKPLPAFAPEENYDYSFANGCFQKAEKYDCERFEKENTRLKKIIKLLEDNLQLVLKQDIDPLLNIKVFAVGISKNYKLYSGFEITQEQYELLKEVLDND